MNAQIIITLPRKTIKLTHSKSPSIITQQKVTSMNILPSHQDDAICTHIPNFLPLRHFRVIVLPYKHSGIASSTPIGEGVVAKMGGDYGFIKESFVFGRVARLEISYSPNWILKNRRF